MIYLFAPRYYFSLIKGRSELTCAVAVVRLYTGKSIVPWGFHNDYRYSTQKAFTWINITFLHWC